VGPLCPRASALDRRRRNRAGLLAGKFDGAAALLGTICEPTRLMEIQTTPVSSASDQDLRPRARTLSWMASMSVAAGEIRAAEGYLLELLAWCAFAERDGSEESTNADDGI
jgi:hypothetical protein